MLMQMSRKLLLPTPRIPSVIALHHSPASAHLKALISDTNLLDMMQMVQAEGLCAGVLRISEEVLLVMGVGRGRE